MCIQPTKYYTECMPSHAPCMNVQVTSGPIPHTAVGSHNCISLGAGSRWSASLHLALLRHDCAVQSCLLGLRHGGRSDLSNGEQTKQGSILHISLTGLVQYHASAVLCILTSPEFSACSTAQPSQAAVHSSHWICIGALRSHPELCCGHSGFMHCL